MKKFVILLVAVLMSLSCKDTPKTKIEPQNDNVVTAETQPQKAHLGKLIMEQECYICHEPKASMADRIAPPMVAIKRHYIDSKTTKEEFTEALIRWVDDPETELKMPGAHAKFGPMPYMPIPGDAIAQIADYIYNTELERPEGFDAYFQKVHGIGIGMQECNCFDYPNSEEIYVAIGLAYAKSAKGALSKNLAKVIQEKGTVGAIQFCYTEATKLTDSVSMMKNAIIKRVSDKARNPENQANEAELGYIEYFKKLVSTGKELKPIVIRENGEVDFYYPITTNALCLQCHGTPIEQIRLETLSALKKFYPIDMAVGYDVNEVRGMWSINFDTDN